MKWMRWTARVLSLAWGGWWTFFGLASGIGEKMNAAGILLHAAVPGLIFLALAIVAWKWELAGGIIVLIIGLVLFLTYPLVMRMPPTVVVTVLLMLALPPLVAGVLFVLGWRMKK